ncbi:MAG: hypothetical protein ACJ73J_10800 [Actinomycetes bacterium]
MTQVANGFPRWARMTAVVAGVALAAAIGVRAIAVSDDAPNQATMQAATEVQDRLASIGQMTYGSWSDHSAGSYLDYLANTSDVEPCMAAAGQDFGYPYIDPYAGRPEYTGAGVTWSEPLMSTSSSELALATAAYEWREARFGEGNPDQHWEDRSRAYQRAYETCRHFRHNFRETPRGFLNVPSDLAGLVMNLESELGPSSDYDRCMQNAGYDVYWDDYGGPDAMHQMVESKAPKLEVSPAKLVQTREWTDFLEYEHEVLLADYACRVDKFVAVMAMIDAPLAEFQRTHQGEIDDMQQEWAAIVAKAKQHGWTPAPVISAD